ncbi:MAG TPA: peptidoglycan-binding protein [Rhodobacteraceae bacterium]|nr:peptidoglycan-binding protein [Paracoccaceae bacterium]
MALSRRTGQRFQASIWPGFVDAMTALLLVLMFVLTIFMVVQFVLRETISGQATELDDLSAQIVNLADALGLERQHSRKLETDVVRLGNDLETAQSQADAQLALIATLTTKTNAQAAELEQNRAAITRFEAQVATLLSQRDAALGQGLALEQKLSELDGERTKLISEQEALQLALAKVRGEVDEQQQAARLAAARHDALKALTDDLRSRVVAREESLSDALARLDGLKASKTTLETELSTANQQLSKIEKTRLADLAAAKALRERLQGMQAELSKEEEAKLAEAAAAQALRDRLKNADAELTAMTLALEEQRKQAENTLTLLAAAEAAKADLNEKLAAAILAASENQKNDKELQSDLAAALAAKLKAEQDAEAQLNAAEQKAVLLAAAQGKLSDVKAQSAKEQRRLALLNQQVAALRGQLGSLQKLLDQSVAKDVAANIQIQSLGTKLNTALARVAAEEKRRRELEQAERERIEAKAKDLERYKSEFFGQLREVLGDEDGVRIEGDRFVFSSEVLFPSGSVDLLFEGKSQIARIAEILRRVSKDIPAEIDWVIRVDGHTDNVPLSGFGRYRDNWELSQGRALSVVRFMSEELGIAPNRLAANGFGEYQPINPENTPAARAQNRRIELKLTER